MDGHGYERAGARLRRARALWVGALFLFAQAACLGQMDLSGIQDAATSVAVVVTESAPLRATSGGVLSTLVAGGKTQAPPFQTGVASMLTQAPAGREMVDFDVPHRDYNPLPDCGFGSLDCAQPSPHTGVDSVVDPATEDSLPVDVLAVAPGVVARIQYMAAGCTPQRGDCGLGSTVILEHVLKGGGRVYSLYAHLDTVNAALAPGMCVGRGTPLGAMGASGFGERYFWDRQHLHLEIKTAPVLGDPRSASANPEYSPDGAFFGYITTPSDPAPDHWGFYPPLDIIATAQAAQCP